jgi:hypothetical protein
VRSAGNYATPVRESFNEVRLRPVSNEHQTLGAFLLKVLPASRLRHYNDFYSNYVSHFEIVASRINGTDGIIAIIRAAAVGRACKADVKQFCADVRRGKGAIADCMKDHAADLSDGCKDAMVKAEAGSK